MDSTHTAKSHQSKPLIELESKEKHSNVNTRSSSTTTSDRIAGRPLEADVSVDTLDNLRKLNLSDTQIKPITSDSRGLGTDALPTHFTPDTSSDKSKTSNDTTIIKKETNVTPTVTGVSEKLNETDSKKTDLHNMFSKSMDYKNLSLFSDKKLRLEI